MGLYFESHVTLDPVFDDRLRELEGVAATYGFRVADLILQKRKSDVPEKNKEDAFCTTRDKDLQSIISYTNGFMEALERRGFVVRRWKIEDTLIDMRIKKGMIDEQGL